MNLIPVIQVKKGKRFEVNLTLANTLKEIFGEEIPCGWGKSYQGVEFSSLGDSGFGWNGHQLQGISMSVTDAHYKSIFRRVKVTKDGKIDADAVKEKFAELKALADEARLAREQSQDTYRRSLELLDRVAKSLGIKPDQYGSYRGAMISSNSPTTLTITGEVDSSQLLAIEKVMGKCNLPKLPIKLVVTEAEAVAVYNILKEEVE